MKNDPRASSLPALTWLIAALLAAGCFGRSDLIELATNSDGLLPAALIWEAVNRPDTWRGFEWPRIPSLLPDMLIYGVVQAIGGSWRMAQLVYAMVSMAGIAGVAGMIGARMTGAGSAVPAAVFLAATSVVLGLAAITGAGAWHLHLLVPAYHSGPFILALGCLLLVPLRSGPAAAPWRMLALVVLACAGTFSDKLFVGFFAVPLLAALLAMVRARQVSLRDAVVVGLAGVLGCALGLLADRLVFPALLTRQGDVPLLPMLMLDRAAAFFTTPHGLAAIGANAIVLTLIWRRRPAGEALYWWVAGAATMVPVTLLSSALWEDAHSQRYLGAVMWWPLLLISPLLVTPSRRHAWLAQPVAVAITLVTAFALAGGHPPGRAMLDWKDRLTSCIARTGREAGLADYWVARRMTAASDFTMQVVQVDRAGAGRIWGNNPVWFDADMSDPSHPPAFSFIVMTELDQAAIRARYGAPSGILRCPVDHLVWLYEDPAAMRRNLAAASPLRLVPGEARCAGPQALRNTGGALPPGPLRADPKRSQAKPLTWGPTIDLPAGAWRIRLRYRLAGGDATWDIRALHGALGLHEGRLAASENGVAIADLRLERPLQAVEVRTFLRGDGAIEVLGADFLPLDWAGASARCEESQ